MKKSRKKAELHVMFDSNSLYHAGKEDQLISPRLCKIIQDPKHTALNVRWVIPRMVQLEREFQFRNKAKHIVTGAQGMPEVFAGTWVGDQSAVESAITQVAERQLQTLGVEVADCNPDLIDWPSMFRAAGLRLPPFDPDPKKEKGFKDMVIGETFAQMCGSFPAHGTDTAILVTADKILRDHVLYRVPNAKVVEHADALANELNLLRSDLDPQVASQLPDLAAELINRSPDFLDGVVGMAKAELSIALLTLGQRDVHLPAGVLGNPIFLRKQLKHVYFACRYDIPRRAQWVPAIQAMPSGVLPLGEAGGPASSGLSPFGSGMAVMGNTLYWDSVTNAPPLGLPADPLEQPRGAGLWQVTLGSSNFGGTPNSPFRIGPAGLIEVSDIQLPSLSFAVTWRANLALHDKAPMATLSDPFIESVELEPW
jgi:hypothetical protein